MLGHVRWLLPSVLHSTRTCASLPRLLPPCRAACPAAQPGASAVLTSLGGRVVGLACMEGSRGSQWASQCNAAAMAWVLAGGQWQEQAVHSPRQARQPRPPTCVANHAHHRGDADDPPLLLLAHDLGGCLWVRSGAANVGCAPNSDARQRAPLPCALHFSQPPPNWHMCVERIGKGGERPGCHVTRERTWVA
mgnify:CR=1 FL=1